MNRKYKKIKIIAAIDFYHIVASSAYCYYPILRVVDWNEVGQQIENLNSGASSFALSNDIIEGVET